jgi:Asp/Glu/hydantoin racemase
MAVAHTEQMRKSSTDDVSRRWASDGGHVMRLGGNGCSSDAQALASLAGVPIIIVSFVALGWI